MATTMQTTGMTAPAASLLPYYHRKEVVKTFVVVTDECENTQDKDNHYFAPLFEKYHKEVYPADLVFVSFLSQHSKGDMVPKLEEKGFKPLRFRFASRPDLTKLDAMLALLSIETPKFESEVKKFTAELEAQQSKPKQSAGVTLEGLSLENNDGGK